MFSALVCMSWLTKYWIPWNNLVYLVSEMLDGLLQGQDLVKEGALEYWFEQVELLLSGHLPPLLQFGLETLHRLQGTLCICKPSHFSVTAPARVKEWVQGEGGMGEIEVERGDEERSFITTWAGIVRQERVFGHDLIYLFFILPRKIGFW